MAGAHQFRRCYAGEKAGSGQADSSAGSGPATEDTFRHITPIAGGELHVSAAGSRVAVEIRTGRGFRNRLTASLSPDDAEHLFRRGAEIVQHARAYQIKDR